MSESSRAAFMRMMERIVYEEENAELKELNPEDDLGFDGPDSVENFENDL